MPSEEMTSTEAWVRAAAPELLSGPLAKEVAQFIAEDDLNGLAHYLQRQAERYQSVVSQAADVSDVEQTLNAQQPGATDRRRGRDLSEADKDRHIAQMEAERRVLDDMLQKKDQTIAELRTQVHTLKNQQEP